MNINNKMTEQDYVSRLRQYRESLEDSRKSLRTLSREESIAGSISADNQIAVYDCVIKRLEELFPELTRPNVETK